MKNTGFFDANNDAHQDGNGYDTNYVSDGHLAGTEQDILWTRINPNNDALVEFAIDYKSMGLTQQELQSFGYFVFEANKDLLDPANYRWNQEYTAEEAGTPYTTEGLGNIYELDTLNGKMIPEPSTTLLASFASSLMLLRRRR